MSGLLAHLSVRRSARSRWSVVAIAALVSAASLLVIRAVPAAAAPVTHVVDDDGQGTAANCDAPDSADTSIQTAVTAAGPGDTVFVCPGTYTEQVTIDAKTLTLTGSGESTTTIQLPATPVSSTCPGGSSAEVIVDICGGSVVTMSGFTVRGPWSSASCASAGEFGISVLGGATLNLSTTTVRDIRDEPLNGCQRGIGILVGRSSIASVGHANIDRATITGYQKNGVVYSGAGTSGQIRDSTVAGVGVQSQIAQNGIQVSDGASADVRRNGVSANLCNAASCGPDFTTQTQSAGILLLDFGSGTNVLKNSVSSNDIGIYTFGTPAISLTKNTVNSNRYEGVIVDQGSATLDTNTIRSGHVGVLVVSFTTGDGTTGDSNATLTGNYIRHNDIGVQAVDLDKAGDAFVPVVNATLNHINANGAGFVNDADVVQQATQNWWGKPTGPSDWATGQGDSVSAEVDFFPWSTNKSLTTFRACDQTGSSLTGTAADEVLCGTAAPDTISGGGGKDLILGLGDADLLNGGGGKDAIIGGDGGDTLNGGSGFDSLQGRADTDTCNVDADGGQSSTCELP